MKIGNEERQKFQKDESGMMVVEAVLTLTVFLVAVIAVIYLINIFTVHNKIQFAINSTAHEISGYSYLYQAFGIRKADQTLEGDAEPYTQPIDDTAQQLVDTMNQIQGLYEDGTQLANELHTIELSQEHLESLQAQLDELAAETGQTVESVKKSAEEMAALFSDGDSLIAGFIYMGISAGTYTVKSVCAEVAARALASKYLRSADRDADTYLRSYGIDGYAGLDFSGSTMFCDSKQRMIDIVVQYDIDLSFIGMILPNQKLHVVQRVSVPAWLDGDGREVSPAL